MPGRQLKDSSHVTAVINLSKWDTPEANTDRIRTGSALAVVRHEAPHNDAHSTQARLGRLPCVNKCEFVRECRI